MRKSHNPAPDKCHSSLRQATLLGRDWWGQTQPPAPSPCPRKASHPAQAPLASWPPLPECPWPLPCSSLSRSQGCPHQEYLLTSLALLATLTTNMLSDKVGRNKVLELKTMSEITSHPHRANRSPKQQARVLGEALSLSLSQFSFLLHFPTHSLLPGDRGLGWF